MDGISRKTSVRINQTLHPAATPQVIIGSLHLSDNSRIEMRAGWGRMLTSLSFYRTSGERIGFAEFNLSTSFLTNLYIDPPNRNRGWLKYVLAGTLVALERGTLTRHPVLTPEISTSNRQVLEEVKKFGFARSTRLPILSQQYILTDRRAFYERIRSLGLTVSLHL